jgi:hypothetical protein
VKQSYNQSIEDVYFWLLSSLREDYQLPDVKKIKDIFTASEQSAFWGQAQQRLTLQQGQVSNYLATIGKLTKELFQIVREIKILDERLALYKESNKLLESKSAGDRRTSQAAEITLKSYWVDLKDGGVKSPGSVYGLASTLGYTVLPDLFFATPPLKIEEVDGYTDKLQVNQRVKDVLRRKLAAYIAWRDHTFHEHDARRKFTVKFLRQHYDSIQMYINWIKPYLKNVKRLQMNAGKTDSEDIIGAFEGSVTEIEIICYHKKKGAEVYPIVLVSIDFRTSPKMEYHQEGYQHKGPIHEGRCEFTLRGYTWTPKELDSFIKMRDDESLEIMSAIDESLKSAIDALGDDLRKYLKEAGEKFPEDDRAEEDSKKAKEKKLKEMKRAGEPFIALFFGFKDIFSALNPFDLSAKKKEGPTKYALEKARKDATKPVTVALFSTYKNFKKANKMVTW